MIVKDEAQVIRRVLDSVLPIIDCWYISDTGSTDGTQDLVQEILGHLPGKLSQDEWVDFATNRNLALRRVQGDYMLVIDADEELILPKDYQLPPLTADAYHIEMHSGSIHYDMLHIVKANIGFYYIGVVHEYLFTPTPNIKEDTLRGIYIERRQEGARSRDPKTYEKDAALLLADHLKNPFNTRTVFYLAQSYRDAANPVEALHWYRHRVTMLGGYEDERYYSQLQIAFLVQEVGEAGVADVIKEFLYAYELNTHRPESLYHLGLYLADDKKQTSPWWNLAALLQDVVRRMTPESVLQASSAPLFYDPSILEYGVELERAVLAYYLDDHPLAIDIYQRLLKRNLNEDIQNLIRANLAYSLPDQNAASSSSELSSSELPSSELSSSELSSSELSSSTDPEREIIILEDTDPVDISPHHFKSLPNPKIALSITTLDRPEEFRRTIMSFMTMAEDLDLISRYWGVDDGSSEVNSAAMQRTAPSCLEWLIKPANSVGHVHSMNLILEQAKRHNIDYLVHLEDDWQFFRPGTFISDAIAILDSNPKIGQVIFNARYAEIPSDQHQLKGGIEQKTLDGKISYLLHEYYLEGTEEYDIFWRENIGFLANVHWPHFSLRPGVWRVSAFEEIGTFQNEQDFEYEYALRYIDHGYQTAFFPELTSLHLGKLLSPDGGSPEAIAVDYLNRGVRFNPSNENSYEKAGRPR